MFDIVTDSGHIISEMGKTFLLVALALASSISSTAYGSQQTGGRLSTPSTYQSPRFRWWWLGGWADANEVANEISEIVAAGFGGAEIADVTDSVGHTGLNPKIYGWGQERWNAAVLAAYTQADRYDPFSCEAWTLREQF